MAPLPLVIGGQRVTIDQLAGQNYVVGYPELIALIVRHCENPSYGYALAPAYIYPLPGKQKIWALPGRSWAPGQRLKAFRIGDSSDYRIIFVHKYDKMTGELWLEVVAASKFSTIKLGGNGFFLQPHFLEPVGASAVAVANGGTAGTNVDEIRASLMLPFNPSYSVLFSDFVVPDSFCRIGTSSSDLGPAYQDRISTNVPFSFSSHPGVYGFSRQATQHVCFGRGWINWADMSGDNTAFEAMVNFDNLSSSNAYTYEVGLIGTATGGKISISYQEDQNTGRFQVIHGVSNSYTTVNSTFTVAADTWYKLRIAIAGSNIIASANGTQLASFSKTNYQNVAQSNLMTPMARLTVTGTTDTSIMAYLDYLYFRKHFPSGR